MRNSSWRSGWARYPRRSRSSNSSACKYLRCRSRAWRINADRFISHRFAAKSVAFRSFLSKTTCIVSTEEPLPQYTPQCGFRPRPAAGLQPPHAPRGCSAVIGSNTTHRGAATAWRTPTLRFPSSQGCPAAGFVAQRQGDDENRIAGIRRPVPRQQHSPARSASSCNVHRSAALSGSFRVCTMGGSTPNRMPA